MHFFSKVLTLFIKSEEFYLFKSHSSLIGVKIELLISFNNIFLFKLQSKSVLEEFLISFVELQVEINGTIFLVLFLVLYCLIL